MLINRKEQSMARKKGSHAIAPTLTTEDVEALPALITARDYAALVGCTTTYANKLCQEGKVPAVKRGRAWLISKAKALRALGLAD